MTDKPVQKKSSTHNTPRVLADFGGRRKIFDRRLKQIHIDKHERRAVKDRRSGFDRRETLNQSADTVPENRQDFPEEMLFNSEYSIKID